MTSPTARAEILARIRANLTGTQPLQRPPELMQPARQPFRGASRDELVAQFETALGDVGAQLHRVASAADAPPILNERIAAAGARTVFSSDAPEVRALLEAAEAPAVVTADSERARLLEAELGLTRAQYGIAETGTLILASPSEAHRLASLLPRVHVALLYERDIVAGLRDGLASVHNEAPLLPVVTFITGPSRTGDIELKLVVGVHGPEELHIILVADAP